MKLLIPTEVVIDGKIEPRGAYSESLGGWLIDVEYGYGSFLLGSGLAVVVPGNSSWVCEYDSKIAGMQKDMGWKDE